MTSKQSQDCLSAIPIRVRFGAVVAGALLELVAISLLLMLAGGLGLWSMAPIDADKMSKLGVGVMLFAGASWVVAAFLGGYSAAVIARATDRRDGLLHGLMSWALACATAAVLACTWFMAALAVGLAKVDVASAMSGQLMLGFFVGDLVALTAALVGGATGARGEGRLSLPVRPMVVPAQVAQPG